MAIFHCYVSSPEGMYRFISGTLSRIFGRTAGLSENGQMKSWGLRGHHQVELGLFSDINGDRKWRQTRELHQQEIRNHWSQKPNIEQIPKFRVDSSLFPVRFFQIVHHHFPNILLLYPIGEAPSRAAERNGQQMVYPGDHHPMVSYHLTWRWYFGHFSHEKN